EVDRREERLVRLAVVLVDDVGRGVVRRERLHDVRAGADRSGQEGVVRFLATLEDVLRIDEAGAGTGERVEPDRVRRAKGHLHRQVIDRFGRLDGLEAVLVGGVVLRVLYPLDGEDHVLRRKRRAVAPEHVRQQVQRYLGE